MWEAATICPANCKLIFDLLSLKMVSESRVTWATSVPFLVSLDLSVLDLGPMYETDRQTDRRQTRIVAYASVLYGAGYNNNKLVRLRSPYYMRP